MRLKTANFDHVGTTRSGLNRSLVHCVLQLQYSGRGVDIAIRDDEASFVSLSIDLLQCGLENGRVKTETVELSVLMKSIRVGNGAGFWGDNLDAPRRLCERGRLDYLTLEYLAELTMSILAHLKSRDPSAGWVTDFD